MSQERFEFRIYVAGEAANSQQALANLRAFCARYLDGRHTIEIIDVHEYPRRALDEGVFLTPALVICSPGPLRTLVGNLARPDILSQTLNLPIHGRE